jgi:hypothetical protein
MPDVIQFSLPRSGATSSQSPSLTLTGSLTSICHHGRSSDSWIRAGRSDLAESESLVGANTKGLRCSSSVIGRRSLHPTVRTSRTSSLPIPMSATGCSSMTCVSGLALPSRHVTGTASATYPPPSPSISIPSSMREGALQQADARPLDSCPLPCKTGHAKFAGAHLPRRVLRLS